ncbi:MAG: hypothetical protein SF029_13650 [bacterium]|nr:hypothetical protein [bacterium]
MKLPNVEQAVVRESKITKYLLSLESEDGHPKAQFFMRFGFSLEAWEALAEALLRHARDHEVISAETTPFGVLYIIEGAIIGMDGRTPAVRSIWQSIMMLNIPV